MLRYTLISALCALAITAQAKELPDTSGAFDEVIEAMHSDPEANKEDRRESSTQAALRALQRAGQTGEISGLKVPMDSLTSAGGSEGMNPTEHRKMMDDFRELLELQVADRLYIFVSLSMPTHLLREYQLDAAITGAELVLRGAPKGMNLQDMQVMLIEIFGQTGVQAPVVIDPRLFDVYSVTTVPTIVFAEDEETDLPCFTNEACDTFDKNEYSTVSGSITMKYALELFEEEGAAVAPYLKLIKDFYGPLVSNDKESELPTTAAGINRQSFDAAMEEVTKRNIQAYGADEEQASLLEQYQSPWAKRILNEIKK